MKQLKNQLVDIANSQFKGKYVFNGQFTDKKAYDSADPAKAITDNGNLDYSINTGINLTVNLIGNDVFGYPPTGVAAPKNEDDNLFHVIDEMVKSLESGSHAGVNSQLSALESRMDKVLTQRAELGARVNRLELMEDRLKDLSLNLQTLQSKTEDADYEELIIKSKVNESIYQASLSVGAKIISPSLVDFLR
jgi:flagellar hook-associated protein 3 FlgL